ncbi:hypothetical protein BS17DRAFT_776615 [Gyrodon lividus]|nr:hypothetical protein BS17DRAFT_776615 [Gyrodon lividus]
MSSSPQKRAHCLDGEPAPSKTSPPLKSDPLPSHHLQAPPTSQTMERTPQTIHSRPKQLARASNSL